MSVSRWSSVSTSRGSTLAEDLTQRERRTAGEMLYPCSTGVSCTPMVLMTSARWPPAKAADRLSGRSKSPYRTVAPPGEIPQRPR
jgi:hypothetical protein